MNVLMQSATTPSVPLVELVHQSVTNSAKGVEQFDDITMLSVLFK